MKHEVILMVVAAFCICVVLCPILIPFLRKLKFGQYVRTDGPKEHLKKSGTPTMGGIVILLSVTAAWLLLGRKGGESHIVLAVMLGFGMIGFLDDYIKIVKKRSMGLTAPQKFAAQLIVTAVFAWYVTARTEVGSMVEIPFSGGMYLELSGWYVPFVFVTILGTVNGANFTDGLDGLAAGVTLLIATFFSVMAVGLDSGLPQITCAVSGALLGFLLYNTYPARVFMGDTGSLALGGFVAATAILMRMPLFIPIVGAVYLAEVCSVVLQVGFYKLTKGRRLLRMAPLHHHFELSGWPETRVVALFSIVTAMLCVAGILGAAC
ncbi:MAG: phospho-N-acetylmuramoyl-pentapeptide-transferase [Lachnospiraceae bacterium]|nr:phospho-N-acetylmuramoyl-pentapeptide-transferase [Lachnospiraceae bacterium]